MDYKADLPPEKKLDIVLQNLVNLSETHTIRYMEVVVNVPAVGYEKEIFEILLKLLKDGYITGTSDTGYGQYNSNFDGRLFIDNGGYTTKALRDANAALLVQMEVDRRRTLDVLLATNSTRLNRLTNRLFWATVVASIAAFFLLIWQVFLWINPVYSDFPFVLFGIVRKGMQ